MFWPSKPETLWTLLMVNPDGNIFEENKDVLHWLMYVQYEQLIQVVD